MRILIAVLAVIALAVAAREPPVVKVTQAQQPEGNYLTDPQHCHLVIEPAFAWEGPLDRCSGGGLTNEGLAKLQARFGVYGQPYEPARRGRLSGGP